MARYELQPAQYRMTGMIEIRTSKGPDRNHIGDAKLTARPRRVGGSEEGAVLSHVSMPPDCVWNRKSPRCGFARIRFRIQDAGDKRTPRMPELERLPNPASVNHHPCGLPHSRRRKTVPRHGRDSVVHPGFAFGTEFAKRHPRVTGCGISMIFASVFPRYHHIVQWMKPADPQLQRCPFQRYPFGQTSVNAI